MAGRTNMPIKVESRPRAADAAAWAAQDVQLRALGGVDVAVLLERRGRDGNWSAEEGAYLVSDANFSRVSTL